MDEDSPTVIRKFLNTMNQSGNANDPVWVTEIGWNRAAESTNPTTLGCARVNQTMVDSYQQAKYLAGAYDFLFTQPTWPWGTRAVAKVFWYQYGDVGIAVKESDCTGNSVVNSSVPVSWDASLWAQTTLQEPTVVVDWWFGLYSGTDPNQGIIEPQPNLARCIYAKYPIFDTVGPTEIANLNVVEECLPVQIYLPIINEQTTVSQ